MRATARGPSGEEHGCPSRSLRARAGSPLCAGLSTKRLCPGAARPGAERQVHEAREGCPQLCRQPELLGHRADDWGRTRRANGRNMGSAVASATAGGWGPGGCFEETVHEPGGDRRGANSFYKLPPGSSRSPAMSQAWGEEPTALLPRSSRSRKGRACRMLVVGAERQGEGAGKWGRVLPFHRSLQREARRRWDQSKSERKWRCESWPCHREECSRQTDQTVQGSWGRDGPAGRTKPPSAAGAG